MCRVFAHLWFLILLIAISSGSRSTTFAQAVGNRASGVVVDADSGDPIPDVEVEVAPHFADNRPHNLETTSTDVHGNFSFSIADMESFQLSARKAGYSLVPGTYQHLWKVEQGHVTDHVVIKLQAGGALRGRVSGVNGQPIIGADVGFLRVDAGANGAISTRMSGLVPDTGADGAFEVSGLEPGRYVVFAIPSPRDTNGAEYVRTYYPSTARLEEATTISVVAHQTIGDLVVTVLNGPAFTVSGRIIDESGLPIKDSAVRLSADVHRGMQSKFSTTTGEDGRFLISGLTADTYNVAVSTPDIEAAHDPISPRQIVIHDTNITELTVVVRRKQ